MKKIAVDSNDDSLSRLLDWLLLAGRAGLQGIRWVGMQTGYREDNTANVVPARSLPLAEDVRLVTPCKLAFGALRASSMARTATNCELVKENP
ncbi:hypothetical protein KPH14_008423 [Odynerus spinipes]|uniref:Uncharacterized protein n=1 Tax=Odynerus spinipes TaxID=1348599 RepID=A0AAD9RE33_9HYME|nr:hypothetical protein KPH14_008423 [Odynerus spinipes]